MIGRVIAFFGWSAICCLLFMGAFFLTQIGDCFDVKECWAYKARAGTVIFIAVPLVWLTGTFFLFRRWNR